MLHCTKMSALNDCICCFSDNKLLGRQFVELRTCAVPERDLKDMENKMTTQADNGGRKRKLEVPVIPDIEIVEDDDNIHPLTVSVLLFTFF